MTSPSRTVSIILQRRSQPGNIIHGKPVRRSRLRCNLYTSTARLGKRIATPVAATGGRAPPSFLPSSTQLWCQPIIVTDGMCATHPVTLLDPASCSSDVRSTVYIVDIVCGRHHGIATLPITVVLRARLIVRLSVPRDDATSRVNLLR